MRKDNPNITFDELHDKVKTYITKEEDLKFITKLSYALHLGGMTFVAFSLKE